MNDHTIEKHLKKTIDDAIEKNIDIDIVENMNMTNCKHMSTKKMNEIVDIIVYIMNIQTTRKKT